MPDLNARMRRVPGKLIGEVVDAHYHRNGICGSGFWTVLFKGHKDAESTVAGHLFVATRFDHGEKEAGELRIAVLRMNDLVDGNAANCWRGDNFAREIDAAIKKVAQR